MRTDVGCFMDAGTHDLAIIEYLFSPGRIIDVRGANLDEFTGVSVRFENGLFAHLVISWVAPEKVRRITIVGAHGSAVLDDRKEKDKLQLFSQALPLVPAIDLNEPLKNELEHFIHCVHTGQTPLTDITFGCRVTEMCDIILRGLERQA